MIPIKSKKEIEKMQAQAERYNKGYGAGAFTQEQLTEYTTPIREKISRLERQITNSAKEAGQVRLQTPCDIELAVFAEQAKKNLRDLKFFDQRAIVLGVVDKIIGTR